MKYVIIGGVAGGASFACRLRRLDENCQIVIYEKSNYVSYANCGLPYYLSGVINNKKDLTLQSPRNLKNRFNIDVFVNNEVILIDKEHKILTIKDLSNNTIYQDNYDKLILSPGSEAIKIAPLNERVFELKNVEDSFKLKDSINKLNAKKIIVIGGGFIGLEIAENLKLLNLDITLIEGSNHVLANLDYEMASFVHKELKDNNINLFLNSKVSKIEELDNKVRVYLNDFYLDCDILIQAMGVRPNSKLAELANLELDIKNSIKVDDFFKTSDKDIYAIGDVVAIKSKIDDNKILIPLAGLANREGRGLANSICREKLQYSTNGIGTNILKVFDLSVASCGFSEELLKRKNIDYEKIYLSPNNHASYYPNHHELSIKVLFDKNNLNILCAQIIGKDGVDKRIDLIAMAIKFNIKITDLADVELSYAPPFSSAKDPINMIGFMAENLVNGLVRQFYFDDIKNIVNTPNSIILDVRDEIEFNNGHILNSINIPVNKLRDNLDKLNKNKTIYIICHSGVRSYYAYRILAQKGFNCYHLAGGYRLYKINNENN